MPTALLAALLVAISVYGLFANPAGAQSSGASLDSHLPSPNIVILLADDMGMGDTSAYQDWSGNADAVQVHTPAMERLARCGVRFTDAHSPHSRCTTTRYALLTGRYCWRTRLKHWVLFGVQGDPLIDRPRITLPEFLKSAGYTTGMVGKWHLGLQYRRSDGSPANGWNDADLTQPLADSPIDHGFDYFYGMSRSHGTSGPDGNRQNTPDQSIGPGWIEGRQVVGATSNGKQLDGSYVLRRVGNVLDEKAFDFIERNARGTKPFFLYIASPANHTPYTPSARLGETEVAGASRFVNGQPTQSPRQDFIYQNDVQLARLVAYLESTDDPRRPGRKLVENTMVIFASDNGADKPDKIFTGPLRSNKGSVYEGGHRIPLIVSWPAGGVGDGNSQTPGITLEELIGLNDIYATIAQVLGRALPASSGGEAYGAEDSVGQLATLRQQPTVPRVPLFSNDHKEASKEVTDERAWVAIHATTTPLPGEWKLLMNQRFAFHSQVEPQELYRLDQDPREEHNLVDDAQARPALDYLMSQALRSAGDEGSSRER